MDHIAGLSSLPISGIAAILLTFLSIPECPDLTGTHHIPFLAPLWTQSCRHLVTLSSPRGRSIRLPSTLCIPSWVKIQGCGVHCSSPSNCFHNFVFPSSSHHVFQVFSRGSYSLSLLCIDCQHFGHQRPGTALISSVFVDMCSQGVAQTLFCLKVFCCAATTFLP